MSTQTNTAKIYISLDCLLDMRQGALVLLDSNLAYEITTSEDYFTREEDKFTSPKYGTLSKELLARLLKDRADTIVGTSLRTKMHRFIKDLIKQLKDQAHNTPYHTAIAVEVNTHPCLLDSAEYEELNKTLRKLLGEGFPITLIKKSEDQLTYQYVKDNYRCMVMYDYVKWMNLYDKEIKKAPLKDTCFYVPKLYFGKPPTAEELQELARHNTDPFAFMSEAMTPLVPMQFLPIALYCVDIPMNRDSYCAIT
ncbi:MAG: hypothetical protein PHQ58_05050 [Rhodoferax sp.]|uniref:hypothetical protein n=1 Tax=Rhodoferax sp. TaxID=50421 RepID=UPI002625BEE7|nr:hypothetical protein [Rhodoferax sp.]MDD2879782.1 hypothetical protein [Rhodoferax sp.]